MYALCMHTSQKTELHDSCREIKRAISRVILVPTDVVEQITGRQVDIATH